MTRLTRKNLKVFASGATNNGVFGSLQANNPTKTNDIETLQSLPAWTSGWNSATETSEMLPPLEEAQAVDYVETYQTAYLFQEGVPEWLGTCEYHEGSWVKSNATGEWRLYQSLADNNTGNAVTDTSKWEAVSFGGGLEVGDVGIAPLGIDETENRRRYLNGQVISQTQFPAFSQRVKNAISTYPSLGTTEALWQQEVSDSDLGQCGKFVVDNELGTIRLPKVVNIQGLQTLAGNLGTTVPAGLPDVFSSSTTYWVGRSGNGDPDGSGDTSGEPGGYVRSSIQLNTTGQSSIYGNSTTVQEEAIQYPYFIQVATGGETNIDVSTEIQLSNPFFFGMYQWFQTDPNNASWLLSNGQYNAKSVYTSYYDWLLSIYNDTGSITGFNVKASTDTYDDYDFVLNLADEEFRLPLKVHGKTGDAVIGNGNGLGITNGTNTGSWAALMGSTFNAVDDVNYPAAYGTTRTTEKQLSNDRLIGVVTDPTKSGIEVDTTGMSLYFYVGAVVQDADVINAGTVLNEIANIKSSISLTPHIIETYHNGSSWYRIWSDGWCEQGGVVDSVAADSYTSATVNLLVEYGDTDYYASVMQWDNGQTLGIDLATGGESIHTKSTDSFVISTYSWTYGRMWRAEGYLGENS